MNVGIYWDYKDSYNKSRPTQRLIIRYIQRLEQELISVTGMQLEVCSVSNGHPED